MLSRREMDQEKLAKGAVYGINSLEEHELCAVHFDCYKTIHSNL